MKISTENLFLRDVYYYDIEACHYQIIKKYGLDISQLDKNNKQQRNITIGKMMKNNPRLTSELRKITTSIISEYLSRNKIREDEVITRQYDGFITTKKLYKTDLDPIPIKESVFDLMLIGSTRDRYIAKNSNETVLKGIPNRYKEMDKFLSSILDINFLSKISIFKSLEKLKEEISNSSRWKLYFIDHGERNGSVMFNRYGELEISKSIAKLMELNDVNKLWYFNHYLKPFTEAIVMEFV